MSRIEIIKLDPHDDRYLADLTRILFWSKRIRAVNLLGGKCSKCGNDDFFVLDFHHTKGNKEFTINRGRRMVWSKLQKEVLKCVLLCRNCHAEELTCRNPNSTDHRHLVVKQKLLEYKNIFSCEKCGYHGINNKGLDFHHKKADGKLFDIMRTAHALEKDKNKTLCEKIVVELDKCEVICRNCHAKEHIDFKWFNKFKNNIMEKSSAPVFEIVPVNKTKILSLYKSGMTGYEIAKTLGHSFCSVYATINKYGKS